MKNENIETSKKEILKILPEKQSNIWKKLKIDRRKCSRIISLMIKENLVVKTKMKGTFMIEMVDYGSCKPKDFSALLSKNGIIAPCIGCFVDCVPTKCEKLGDWID